MEKEAEIHIIKQEPSSGNIHSRPSKQHQRFRKHVGKTGGSSSQYSKSFSEPTLDFFNKFVSHNTHCLMGRTGFKVSRVSLGSMNFGAIDKSFGERPGQLEEAEAHKILDRYLELGGNCIETANFYPWFGSEAGMSEKIIGNWLNK
jgi:hypothetical protein